MKVDFYVLSPAGNITILVETSVEREAYGRVASALLADKAFAAEQAGFLVPPQLGAEVRLEMMGGEFCGNALRSTGYLHAHLRGMRGSGVVRAEISGCDIPMDVRVDTVLSTASTDMPLPLGVEPVAMCGKAGTLVRFSGIVHVVFEQGEPEEELVREAVAYCLRAYGADAVGVMFLELDTGFLRPAVYVRDTDSLVYESSCASGSAAVAAALSARMGDGEHAFELRQPGGTLRATATRAGGKLTALRIGGEVRLLGHYTRELEI